jgi:hypothetical protein
VGDKKMIAGLASGDGRVDVAVVVSASATRAGLSHKYVLPEDGEAINNNPTMLGASARPKRNGAPSPMTLSSRRTRMTGLHSLLVLRAKVLKYTIISLRGFT